MSDPMNPGFRLPRMLPVPKLSQELTPEQEEIKVEAKDQKQKYLRRQRMMKPVQFVFDLLQRGQYTTANLAQDLLEGKSIEQIAQGLWQGITGKRKGDWETTLFGGQDVGETVTGKGLIPWAPKTGFGKFARKAIGFGANVALDPTTYTGGLLFGKATKAGKAAAKAYAKSARLLAVQDLAANLGKVPAIAKAGVDEVLLKKLANESAEKAAEYLHKTAGQAFDKWSSKVYNRAMMRGLRSTEGELAQEVGSKATGIRKTVEGKIKAMQAPRALPRTYTKTQKAWTQTKQLVDDWLRRNPGSVYHDMMEGGALYDQAVAAIVKNELWASMPPELRSFWSKLNMREHGAKIAGLGPGDARLIPSNPKVSSQGPLEGVASAGEQFYQKAAAARTKLYPHSLPREGLQEFGVRGGHVRKVMDWLEKMETRPEFKGKTGAEIARILKLMKAKGGRLHEISKLENVHSLGTFAKAGERSFRFFGAELGKRQAGPAVKFFSEMREKLADSKVIGVFSNAYWGVMNNPKSPVAVVRNALGFRNPYESMLRSIEMDVSAEVAYARYQEFEKIKTLADGAEPGDLETIWKAMMDLQESRATNFAGALANQQMADPEKAKKLTELYTRIREITGNQHNELKEWAAEGLIADVQEIKNYLPINRKSPDFYKRVKHALPSRAPRPTQQRVVGWEGNVQAQKEKMKWLMGVDDETAQFMVDHGQGTELVTDIVEMLGMRAKAQARLHQRVEMIRQFRAFGLNIHDMVTENPVLGNELMRPGGMIQQLALTSVDDWALQGFYFDRPVADILGRAAKISGDNAALSRIGQAIGSFTSWWKGWVTMSGGFHVRNHVSNQITGFLKFGPRWFNPHMAVDSMIGTMLGLHGRERGTKLLLKIMPEDYLMERMASRIGGHRLDWLADWANRTGVISRSSHGFDQARDIKEFMNIGVGWKRYSPFSTKFAPMQASRTAGSHIESWPRFQSFLMDLKDQAGKGAGSDSMLDYAKLEAKKWFLDYEDLTEVEEVIKKAIPFYTWVRKNISNQISGMLSLTDMYSLMPKAQKALEAEGLSQDYTPEYMQELGMFPVKQTERGFQMLWPGAPISDLNKLPIRMELSSSGIPLPQLQAPGEVLNNIMEMAHPTIKSIVQIIPEKGYDLFYKTELGEQAPAPRLMQVLRFMPGVLQFLDGAANMLGMPEGLNLDVDQEKGKLIMDAKIAKVLDENIPILKILPKFMDAAELVPLIGSWKREVTGVKEPDKKLQRMFDVVSFFAGIKFRELDVMKEKDRVAFELMAKAEKERLRKKHLKPGYRAQRTKWMANQRARQQKVGLR